MPEPRIVPSGYPVLCSARIQRQQVNAFVRSGLAQPAIQSLDQAGGRAWQLMLVRAQERDRVGQQGLLNDWTAKRVSRLLPTAADALTGVCQDRIGVGGRLSGIHACGDV